MSENESLRHTPAKYERKESEPYQSEGDPAIRPDEGPKAERPIASGGNNPPDRKTERVPPVAPANATYESGFDEFAGTESVSTEDRP